MSNLMTIQRIFISGYEVQTVCKPETVEYIEYLELVENMLPNHNLIDFTGGEDIVMTEYPEGFVGTRISRVNGLNEGKGIVAWTMPTSVTLYRPMNETELQLINNLKYKGFPPRKPEQPIFYPVLNERYANDINKWNIEQYGAGYVVKFSIDIDYFLTHERHNVGLPHHNELWIQAEELDIFNSHIIGDIEVIGYYTKT